MAINALTQPTASTPSYTPSISTDYNAQNEIAERNTRGYNAVSLTNWDATTTAPQVAAGSVIEANGIHYDVTTNTTIDTSSASSGTIYLYFDDTVPQFEYLDTSPTWSNTLNGWYSSTKRFAGHLLHWDGSSAFTGKNRIDKNKQDGFENLLSHNGVQTSSLSSRVGGDIGVDYIGDDTYLTTISLAGLNIKKTTGFVNTTASFVKLFDWVNPINGTFKIEIVIVAGTGTTTEYELRRDGEVAWSGSLVVGTGGRLNTSQVIDCMPGEKYGMYSRKAAGPGGSPGIEAAAIGISEDSTEVRKNMMLAMSE